jgi:hypothetical protein
MLEIQSSFAENWIRNCVSKYTVLSFDMYCKLPGQKQICRRINNLFILDFIHRLLKVLKLSSNIMFQ